MYKWIFASTYKYYSRFKNETPRFSAAAVVALSQFAFTFLAFALLKKGMEWDFTRYASYKYIVLPIVIGWLGLVYNYYSKERVTILLREFDELPKWKRKFWASMSLVFFLLPLILNGFALSKP